MKQKPFTLIEENSEFNNDCFYDKVNKIIEEERRKNANICITPNDKRNGEKDKVQCTS